MDAKFKLARTILVFLSKFVQKGYFWSKAQSRTSRLDFAYCKQPREQVVLRFGMKFASTGYFRSKADKVNTTIDFSIPEWVWVKKYLKLTISIFWKKFGQEQFFCSKTSNFKSNWEFGFFDKMCPWRVLTVRKNENHH